MANTSSAIKKVRQIKRRTAVNRANRTEVRTQVKKLQRSLDSKDAEGARKLLSPTVSAVDKAVQKGILTKNKASRMKSRLTARLNKLATAPAG